MKKKILLLIAVATLGLTAATMAQVPNYVPTNGLVGWWPFNGNANDESGNSNNGTVNGATLTTDRFGVVDKSYSFSNDDITVNIQNSFFSNDFSISTWVLLNNFNNTYPTFVTQQNSYLTLQFANSTNPPVVNFYFLNNYQMPGQQVEDGHVNGGAIPLNTWINVVIVNNNKINKLYINGVFVSSSSPSILQGLGLGNFLKFGNGDELPLEEFNGKLDDIGIWNRALNQQEISALYNGNICYQTITVTDTLLINMGITGFNPITFNNTIKIFPNPTNDHITIDYGNFASLNGYQIKITNSLGQQMFQTPINQQSNYVSLASWGGNGLYFVYIIDPQGNTLDIRKIVLQ
jgi:hypothetical protein